MEGSQNKQSAILLLQSRRQNIPKYSICSLHITALCISVNLVFPPDQAYNDSVPRTE